MELKRDLIIKALEYCINNDLCDNCPIGVSKCHIIENALSLINELTEENEKIGIENFELVCELSRIKDSTVRKMQEQIKAEIDCFDKRGGSAFINKSIVFWFIDQIAKEILEGDNEASK